MADRQVTRSGKDKDGDITKLCNSNEWWSPRMKNDAISDIENRTHSYYTTTPGGKRANIIVVKAGSGKYLRTDQDTTTTNNLDNLPDC